jgi:hypothetical protein
MAEISIDNIEVKEDSQAKLNAVSGLPTKHVHFAGEFNAVVKAVKKSRIVQRDELLVFKVAPNENEFLLESGDFVQGFVEGQFINAHYASGDPTLLASYVMEEIE